MFRQLDRWLSPYVTDDWLRSLAWLGIALALGWLARLVFTSVLGRLAQRSGTDLDDKVIRIFARPVMTTVVLSGIYLASLPLGFSTTVIAFVASLTLTIGLLTWCGAILRISRPVLESLARLADRVQWIERRTVPLIDNFGRVALFILAIYLLLRIWDLDVAPWLASAGVVGIALGLAAKDSLANLFGGLFIIADAPYKHGDYINLESGERGEVTNIGLRSTRLLTRDDIEVTVPNAQIAAAKINNEAGGRWSKMRVRVPIGVAYGSDVAQVKEVLAQAAAVVELAEPDPEPRVRFRALGDSALQFELLVWIAQPELRGQAVDALLTEVYNRLNAAGIGIPFPQRELHIAAPIRTEMASS